jgi:hypothetical protein
MRRLLHRPWHKARTETSNNFSAEAAPFGELRSVTSHGATHHKKIFAVCIACNTGWMNDHETVRELLKPLMKGESIVLNRKARYAIARWITLKIMVLENDPDAEQRPIFSRAQRLAFKRRGTLPRWISIWLFGLRGERWYDSVSISSARIVITPHGTPPPDFTPVGPGRNIQSVTWGARNLLIHTFAVTHRYLNAELSWDGPPASVRLWPLLKGPIIWPPNYFLTDWFVDELPRQFDTLVGVPAHEMSVCSGSRPCRIPSSR